MISDESTVVASDHLTVADLDGESVLLDQEDGVYYGLNEVGTRILKLIEQPRAVDDIVERIVDEFHAERARVQSDVVSFLDQMLDRGLVQIADETETV